jgi:hypothetical protein
VSDVSEVYLVPSRGAARCLVCTPSAEALVDALREGAFTLCAAHLLRAHVHGNDEDGVPSLGPLPPRPEPPLDPGVGIKEGGWPPKPPPRRTQ